MSRPVRSQIDMKGRRQGIGQRDENWPDGYAENLMRDQSGEELPA